MYELWKRGCISLALFFYTQLGWPPLILGYVLFTPLGLIKLYKWYVDPWSSYNVSQLALFVLIAVVFFMRILRESFGNATDAGAVRFEEIPYVDRIVITAAVLFGLFQLSSILILALASLRTWGYFYLQCFDWILNFLLLGVLKVYIDGGPRGKVWQKLRMLLFVRTPSTVSAPNP